MKRSLKGLLRNKSATILFEKLLVYAGGFFVFERDVGRGTSPLSLLPHVPLMKDLESVFVIHYL